MNPPRTFALKALGVFTCVLSALSIANSQNIVLDPSFQGQAPGPNFTNPWTLTEQQPPGPPNVSFVGTNQQFAHNGSPGNNQYAALSDDPGQTGKLMQTLTTIPNSFYTLSFWLAFDFDPTSNPPVPPGSNSFQALFNGLPAGAIITSPPQPQSPGGIGPYVQYTFTNLLAPTNSNVLEFDFRHDTDYWRLDDVSMTRQNGRVPEGGVGLGLSLSIFAALLFVWSRGQRKTALR